MPQLLVSALAFIAMNNIPIINIMARVNQTTFNCLIVTPLPENRDLLKFISYTGGTFIANTMPEAYNWNSSSNYLVYTVLSDQASGSLRR